MFICDACKNPTGPRVSPVVKAEYREVRYINKDVEGNEKVTAGTEVEKEYKLCPPCASVKVVPEAPVDLKHYLAVAEGYYAHARKCNGKKVVKGEGGEKLREEDCKVCERIIANFASMPLHVLSIVLEEPYVRTLTFKGR